MTEYAVLLTADENLWEKASDEDKVAMFGRHEEFSRLLAERGHTVTAGAELTHSRQAKLVRRGADDAITVADGPFAESVEQLGGFYSVQSDDLDDLLEICAVLADGTTTVEVRPAVDHSAAS
ncbi:MULTISPECIES: YciI family protein [unclassified Nocardioides]|uniref:YciI family protein n=1 Tax=unclassified Nocardioides TaxID=2615069 RepID=UPI0006F48304|nr:MULTISPECIES: YciI family protein [unclassified Nocardioides]KRA31299.1 hypothetical protein ASD81_17790 [Nocardioides sp. Root614]KRA87920.1 hypothetical protein ASD84_18065 [Nocardioides sp. Root682]